MRPVFTGRFAFQGPAVTPTRHRSPARAAGGGVWAMSELLEGKRIDMPAGGAHMTQVALPPTPEVMVNPDQLSLGD
jgi:hypothetical protein